MKTIEASYPGLPLKEVNEFLMTIETSSFFPEIHRGGLSLCKAVWGVGGKRSSDTLSPGVFPMIDSLNTASTDSFQTLSY